VVGSMAGFAGGSRVAVYTGSKSYEQMLTETLWWELKPFGIDVLMLIAGTAKTPAMARMGLNLEGTGHPVMDLMMWLRKDWTITAMARHWLRVLITMRRPSSCAFPIARLRWRW
jgi:short-subunit dehydrogenase